MSQHDSRDANSSAITRWLPVLVVVLALMLVLQAWVPRWVEWSAGGRGAARPYSSPR